jgi:acyl-CoA thioesterase-1
MNVKRLSAFLLAFCVSLMASVTASRAETLQIVGFGDSLMAGYQLDAAYAFPVRLEAALQERGHDVVIANAGVSGDTSSAGLSRLDWSVPDGTDAVILELGANDMLRGIDPARTEANIEEMITVLTIKRDSTVFSSASPRSTIWFSTPSSSMASPPKRHSISMMESTRMKTAST